MSFRDFLVELTEVMRLTLPQAWFELQEPDLARMFLSKLNSYFYQTYDGIGTTKFNGDELKYFSDFHKFWEAHHAEILEPRTDDSQVRLTAACLRQAVAEHGPEILAVTHDTMGLPGPAIAAVRFFTANQDFRQPPRDAYGLYADDPQVFAPERIYDDPGQLLEDLKLANLSQTDKRRDFARNAAAFLLERRITPFELAQTFDNDALAIREALVNEQNMGYGSKKANMFIRDMYELKVWPELRNLDQIDVASDINTMKLALRTGILRTKIPLLSSFLDIFCHQYDCIDAASAGAWREVWLAWKSSDPPTAPASPCLLDFLLYSIGRECCKETVYEYQCGRGHKFLCFNGAVRRCRACRNPEGAQVAITGRFLPCQVDPQNLPREDGQLLARSELLRRFDGVCILANACQPTSARFRALDPPRSISIKGRTGWTESYANRERGGGGMMG